MAAQEVAVNVHLRVNHRDTCAHAACKVIRIMRHVRGGERHGAGHLRSTQQHEMNALFVVGRRMLVAVQRRKSFAIHQHPLCPALRRVDNRQMQLRGQRLCLQLQDAERIEVVAKEIALGYMLASGQQVLDNRKAENALRVVVFLLRFAEDEDAPGALRMHRLELLALCPVAVQNNQSASQLAVVNLRQQALAHFLRVLFRQHDDRLRTPVIALAGYRGQQHLVRSEEQHMVVKTVTEDAAAVGRGAVLDDVAQDGNEHAGNQHQTEEVDDNLEDDMPVGTVDKLSRRQNKLDNLAQREMKAEHRTDAPEQQRQQTHDQHHPHQLTPLALTQQTVYQIYEFVHKRFIFAAKLQQNSHICKILEKIITFLCKKPRISHLFLPGYKLVLERIFKSHSPLHPAMPP